MNPTLARADEKKTNAFNARTASRGVAQSSSQSGFMPVDVRHAAGNFAVQHLLQRGTIRAKLAVSTPGDAHEQEADRAADTVMRMTNAHSDSPLANPVQAEPGLIQRKCACEDTQASAGGCDTCREKQLNVQRRAASGDGVAGGPKVHEALRSGGQPLDGASRSFFEPRFGHDLSRVRIHSDAKATESAKTVNALAYTVGRDIVFGAGQYDSGSQTGRKLLAHELAHVIQQDFGAGLGEGVSGPLVQRQTPTGGAGGAGGADGAGAAPDPAASTDPNAPIAPPPEHAERVAQLDEMKKEIDQESQRREDVQAEVRAMPPASTTEEDDTQRDSLKAELTNIEYDLEYLLKNRVDLITEAIQGLEAVLPGSSPHVPKNQSLPEDAPVATDYSVQTELVRLYKERTEAEAQLLVIKRCLARKRVKEIKTELDKPDVSPEDRQRLESEKGENEEFLKTTAANVKCAKPATETNHPTEVSDRELQLLKVGEHLVLFPYIAEEGKSDKNATDKQRADKAAKGAGCTIGYGHVITLAADKTTCKHPPTQTAKAADEPKKSDSEQPKQEPATDTPKQEPAAGAPKKKRGITLLECVCTPEYRLPDEAAADKLLKDDIAVHAKWIKQHVFVDLDQWQFDALIDLSLHHGSLDKDFLDVINSKLCVDDEAVRQEYLKANLGVKDRPGMGTSAFKKRRMERVWSPKGDDDPTCI